MATIKECSMLYISPFNLIKISLKGAYTAFTVHEMGNIPFPCPDSYNYTLPLLHTACQIRATNLIFMWAYPTFLVFSVTFLVFYDNDVNDVDEKDFISPAVSAVPDVVE